MDKKHDWKSLLKHSHDMAINGRITHVRLNQVASGINHSMVYVVVLVIDNQPKMFPVTESIVVTELLRALGVTTRVKTESGKVIFELTTDVLGHPLGDFDLNTMIGDLNDE